MYTCAVSLENCRGENLGYRGICSSCYKQLVKEGLIKEGDKFEDFPEWLQEMIRIQAAQDTFEERHSVDSLEEAIEKELA